MRAFKDVKPEGRQRLEVSLVCVDDWRTVDIHAQCVMVGRSGVDIPCVNRFAQLADECESVDDGGHSSVVSEGEGGDLSIIRASVDALCRDEIESVSAGRAYRKLKVATRNFSGLCSKREQKEVAEILSRLNIDIVAGQESCEREGRMLL